MFKQGSPFAVRPSLSLWLLMALFAALWLFGGASRADALGQVMTRASAWGLLIGGCLFLPRPVTGRARPVAILLIAAAGLALVQLIPLPPAIWEAMPGRPFFAEAMLSTGQEQPWRPWSLSPSATRNALAALVVPFVALLFVLGLRRREHSMLPTLLLGLVVASVLIGLLQFTGAISGYPFVNTVAGAVSGNFANRNHLALFIAVGTLFLPVWIFIDGRRPGWRTPVALGLLLLFLLTLLAIGSRAGLALGLIAIPLGLAATWAGVKRQLRHAPRWAPWASAAGLVGLILAGGVASVSADRAETVNRVFALDVGQDVRHRATPAILSLISDYFPMGSGLGGFDPIFRAQEPFALLKPTYINHAHNDFLEIALDAGVFGIVLVAAGILWWAWASARAWRGVPNGVAHDASAATLARLGSAIVLLVLLASIFDYPARTPMIMALVVVAAVWLSGRHASALPDED